MNNLITNFINKLKPVKLPIPLGRWKIENCHKQMNHKIDLSNEDHCGPCGQYALEKININIKNNIDKNKKLTKL